MILDIILIRITGLIAYKQILFFPLILFIDLFIDLRYYFDKNNGGLKLYKQILFFTLTLFIDLFIDFRYYFDTNNVGLKV